MTPEERAARVKAYEEKAKAILSAQQNSRLHEIAVQLAKNRAILREDVQTQLGLSADTIQKAKDLQANAQKANQEVQTKMRNQEIEQADARAIMTKNNDALETELGKLLSADQATKLKAMGGAAFTADPPQARRGGGGGN